MEVVLLVLQRRSLPHFVASILAALKCFPGCGKLSRDFSVEHGVPAPTTVLGPAAVLCQSPQCLGDS